MPNKSRPSVTSTYCIPHLHLAHLLNSISDNRVINRLLSVHRRSESLHTVHGCEPVFLRLSLGRNLWARICKSFKEPRNWFPDCRDRFLGSLNRLQIRALDWGPYGILFVCDSALCQHRMVNYKSWVKTSWWLVNKCYVLKRCWSI
jgi:hypothetical protein